ncbi:MAG: hypothetical protein HQP61_07180 [Peptococcaceae bacterium]|nr:hypothetical protein [Candidatus Syntrophopropionicum ammoniitolerans]
MIGGTRSRFVNLPIIVVGDWWLVVSGWSPGEGFPNKEPGQGNGDTVLVGGQLESRRQKVESGKRRAEGRKTDVVAV